MVPGERELRYSRALEGKPCNLPPFRWLKSGLMDYYRALDSMRTAETHRRDQYELMLAFMTSVSAATSTPLSGGHLKKLSGFLHDVHAIMRPDIPRALGDKSELDQMAAEFEQIVGKQGEHSEVRVRATD